VEDLIQTNYALDTFYFLVMGALVMFMAPGFAMLEAGLVRAKNTSEADPFIQREYRKGWNLA